VKQHGAIEQKEKRPALSRISSRETRDDAKGKVRQRYIIAYVSGVTFREYPTGFPRRRHMTMLRIHGGDSSVRCKS
jgi:hypothetical protein